jgi:hypothetical protein
MLRVSKAIYTETETTLYHNNMFEFSNSSHASSDLLVFSQAISWRALLDNIIHQIHLAPWTETVECKPTLDLLAGRKGLKRLETMNYLQRSPKPCNLTLVAYELKT